MFLNSIIELNSWSPILIKMFYNKSFMLNLTSMKNIFLKTLHFYKDLGDRALCTIYLSESGEENIIQKNSTHILLNDLNKIVTLNSSNFKGLNQQFSSNSTAEIGQYSHAEIPKLWEETCICLFKELESLDKKFNQSKFIKKEDIIAQTDFIVSQLTQFSYYVGQIVSLSASAENKFQNVDATASSESDNNPPENSSPICFAKSDEVRDDYKI